MRAVFRSLLGMAAIVAAIYLAYGFGSLIDPGLELGRRLGWWHKHYIFGFPAAGAGAFLARAGMGVVVAGVLSVAGLICTALSWATWTEEVLQRIEERLPKRPPPLSELHKDAKQDIDRVTRFL